MRNFLDNRIYNEDMEKIYMSGDWGKLFDSSVYISGAAGMIASYVCMFLVYLNETKAADITVYAGIRDLKKAAVKYGQYLDKPYFNVITKDVCLGLEKRLKVDYIIHAAGLASPQYYGKTPVETITPNTIGTYRLLEYAKDHSLTGMIFFSSGAVYGSIAGSNLISEDMRGVSDFLYPGCFYGESKRCGEMLCKAFAMEYGVPVTSVRIYHTYGPTMDIEHDTRVFAEFVGDVVNGHDITVKSEGTERRAFCYISDAVSAIYRILLNGKPGESYNMGNCQEYVSITGLAEKLAALFPEKKLRVIYEKRKEEGYVSTNTVICKAPNINKLKTLGWTPQVTLEEGFLRTVQAIEIERELT